MGEPVTAICPRCQQHFTCKAAKVTQCDCFEITMTPAQRDYIGEKYQGCLCVPCLIALQSEYEEKLLEGRQNK